MSKTISMKCPQCGASFEIDEERETCFCSYCGAKILVVNGQEHKYRKIDEARIREAETREAIRLKELEIVKQKQKFKQRMIIVAVVVIVITFIAGILMYQSEQLQDVGEVIIFVMAFSVFLIPMFYLMKHSK